MAINTVETFKAALEKQKDSFGSRCKDAIDKIQTKANTLHPIEVKIYTKKLQDLEDLKAANFSEWSQKEKQAFDEAADKFFKYVDELAEHPHTGYTDFQNVIAKLMKFMLLLAEMMSHAGLTPEEKNRFLVGMLTAGLSEMLPYTPVGMGLSYLQSTDLYKNLSETVSGMPHSVLLDCPPLDDLISCDDEGKVSIEQLHETTLLREKDKKPYQKEESEFVALGIKYWLTSLGYKEEPENTFVHDTKGPLTPMLLNEELKGYALNKFFKKNLTVRIDAELVKEFEPPSLWKR